MQSALVAEAAGEIDFRVILLWHSQGRRKGDPKHTPRTVRADHPRGPSARSIRAFLVFSFEGVRGGCLFIYLFIQLPTY